MSDCLKGMVLQPREWFPARGRAGGLLLVDIKSGVQVVIWLHCQTQAEKEKYSSFSPDELVTYECERDYAICIGNEKTKQITLEAWEVKGEHNFPLKNIPVDADSFSNAIFKCGGSLALLYPKEQKNPYYRFIQIAEESYD